MKTLFRCEFGSHLYGTNTPSSDHDYKSIHIPNARDILLQRVVESTGHKVVRFEGDKNTPEDTDDESYSLQKYLKLLAEGQTVTIDMLFTPKPLITSVIWEEIKSNKDRLLTKKSASFVGYCRTQANKYGIKGSRVSAAKEAVNFFGDAIIKHGLLAKVGELDEFPTGEHATIFVKETTPGRFETYYDCCNRLVGFKNTLKEAHKIYSRIYEEYGKRAKLAETNEGIDWKALSHAVRVGHEALSLLSTGVVSFPLFNAKHVLDIKLGKLPYNEVAKEIEELLEDVEVAEKSSSLREEPDYEYIDNLVERVYRNEVLEHHFISGWVPSNVCSVSRYGSR
jgi:hypothetical protein